MRTLTWTALAAGLASGAAYPQDSPAPDPSTQQAQVFELVLQAQAEGGENSPGLIEPLMDLGLLLEAQGDFTPAVEAFARARDVVRVNYGLSTLTEALLLRHLVRVEEARGNPAAAWEYEQAALELANHHPDDIRSAQIFGEVAEKRMIVLQRYRAGKYPPQIVLGCYYAKISSFYGLVTGDAELDATPPALNSCTSGHRTVAVLALLMEARGYDAAALDVALRNGGYASQEFGDFVGAVFRKTDTLRELVPQYDDPFITELLDRLLAYEPDDALSLRRHAEILVHSADLAVLRAHDARRYGSLEPVIAQYEEALNEFGDGGASPEAIGTMFSPYIPIVLPTFEANPLVSYERPDVAGGYIDVTFEVTRSGKSTGVTIGATTATRAAQKDLIQFIERSTFRPRVVNGRIADAAPVVFRYYPQQPRE